MTFAAVTDNVFTLVMVLALTAAILLVCMAAAWLIGTLWDIDEMYRWLLESSR